MKNKLSIFIALLFSLNAYGQWTSQLSGTTEKLLAVQFVNSNTGYVVGKNGIILKTSNSGEDWIQLNGNTAVDLNSVCFMDAETGYVGGSYFDFVSSSRVGIILKTIDGGDNWTDLNFLFEEDLSEIFFINAEIGFASCYSKGIHRTTDGGLSWTEVGFVHATSTFFPSENIGYALMNGGIGKTIDGGLNWSQIKDGDSPDYDDANTLRSIFFTSDTKGYFGCRYFCGIYSTTDGGSNLDFTCTPTYSLHFPSENIGYALTSYDGSIIQQTIDAGTTWQEIHQHTSQLYDIYFANNNVGWAVGDDGAIIHSANVVGLENKINSNEILIYPNPSNGVLHIQMDENSKDNPLKIYNSVGRLVAEYPISQGGIDVKGLSEGVYLLKIATDNGLATRKIIIK